MNFDQLKYFVETVQCHSINKAAQNLYVNQSTLTVALKSLETELGCQLLIRSHSGVKTTAEGERIYLDAQKMLNTYQEWKQLAQQKAHEKKIVTIFCLETVANTFMRDVSRKVSLEYPHISLNVQIRTPQEMQDDSSNTIFISSFYMGNDKRHYKNSKKVSWASDLLFEDQLCVYVNKENPFYSNKTITLDELKQQKLVFSSHQETASVPLMKSLDICAAYQISTSQDMLQLAHENNFCTILPKFLTQFPQYFSFHELKPVCIRDFDTKLLLYLAYPAESQLSDEEKQIIELIKEVSLNYQEKIETDNS